MDAVGALRAGSLPVGEQQWVGSWIRSQLRTRASSVAARHDVALAAEKAFEELYAAMAERTLVFFTRRTADPEIARDLWSETWTRAYGARGRFRGTTRHEAEGWIIGIGRKVLADYYKRGAVERRAMARLELERPDLDDDGLLRLDRMAGVEEMRRQLDEAFKALPYAQARALQLRVVDGLGYDLIARRMGCSEQTVRARVSRGLRTLSDIVTRDGGQWGWL